MVWFYVSSILLFFYAMAALYTDARWKIIPNKLTVFFGVLGTVGQFLFTNSNVVWSVLFGLCIGFIPMFILYLLRAVGAGDVKFFGVIGIIGGSHFTIQSMILSILFAGIIGIIILLWKGQFIKKVIYFFQRLFFVFQGVQIKLFTSEPKQNLTRIPFMYAVFPAICTLLYMEWNLI